VSGSLKAAEFTTIFKANPSAHGFDDIAMRLTSPPGLNARDWRPAPPRATFVSCMTQNVHLVQPARGISPEVATLAEINMTTSCSSRNSLAPTETLALAFALFH